MVSRYNAYMRSFKKFISILFILSIPVNLSAQDFRIVHDGLEYAEVTKEISGLKVNINLLRLDLSKVRLDVVHAMDEAIGVEKTSSIATRHGALAAINAGFFRLDNSLYAGDAAGALRIDRIDFSESASGRAALFIMNDLMKTEPGTSFVRIGRYTITYKLKIGKQNLDLSGINRERKDNEIILFNPEFHRTTLSENNGLEVVVRNGRVREIRDGKGSAVIPRDGFVISAAGTARVDLLKFARVGTRVSSLGLVKAETSEKGAASYENILLHALAEDIVAGVPQLIKNGKIDIAWEQEKSSKSFVETRHPRTAVAKLKDGKFLMITVDGRSESSGGIGLEDLAGYLLSLGAVDAMNLDGGGSTTMFLDGKVVNHPSDKEGERKVSDALIVTPRTRISPQKGAEFAKRNGKN
jgi:Phosphodiester glycosidase